MITPSLPSNLANAISPYSPVGKLAVGEETIEARNTPFKPVEEAAEVNRQENRASTAERAAEAEERVEFEPRSNSDNEDRNREQQQKKEAEKQQQQEQQRADQQLIDELARRDREVRAHEQAHNSAGGQLTGSPSYRYQRGPDGVSYAISGEVAISLGAVTGDPQATLQAAQTVQRAALAPADPSPQDHRVAALAAQAERQALEQLAILASEERAEIKAETEAQAAERERQRTADQQKSEERRYQQALAAEEQAVGQIESVSQTVDINQRLIDIGVIKSPTPIGGLLNLTA